MPINDSHSRGKDHNPTLAPTGFPSPAGDYADTRLDPNSLLIRHPAATFFMRVEGDSMAGAGIYPGDVLVVDRALEASENDLVVAVVNGEFALKRIRRDGKRLLLVAENPLEITPEMEFDLWGVVTYVIHRVK